MSDPVRVIVEFDLDLIAARVAEAVVAVLPPGGASPYLNVEQAAEYLACPKSRIYDLVSLDKVKSYRDGRRVLFRREDLDTYLSPRDV